MVHVLCKILKHNQNPYVSIVTGFFTSVIMQKKIIYWFILMWSQHFFVSETLPNLTSLKCWYHENSKGNLRLKHEAATQAAVSCWFTVNARGKKLIRVIMFNYAHTTVVEVLHYCKPNKTQDYYNRHYNHFFYLFVNINLSL